MTLVSSVKNNISNSEFQQVVVRFGFFCVFVAYIGLGEFDISNESYALYGSIFFIYISINYWHVTRYPNIAIRPLVTLFF